MSVMCFIISLVILVIFSNCCLWACTWFLLSFLGGNGYFNSLVSRVRDSSSAGHSMTSVSFLGAYNSVVEWWKDLGCK